MNRSDLVSRVSYVMAILAAMVMFSCVSDAGQKTSNGDAANVDASSLFGDWQGSRTDCDPGECYHWNVDLSVNADSSYQMALSRTITNEADTAIVIEVSKAGSWSTSGNEILFASNDCVCTYTNSFQTGTCISGMTPGCSMFVYAEYRNASGWHFIPGGVEMTAFQKTETTAVD